jgi:soluble lytic murein transglycosylase-like protein
LTTRTRPLQAVALGLALWLAVPALWAQTQIWGYVDKRGASHFSDHQVDTRYELFYQGAPVAKGIATAPGAPRVRRSVNTRFEVSVAYKAVRHLIREAAAAHGLEYELLKAVIATESGFDARAVSPKGAVGLMQLMPDTAQRFGVRPLANQSLEQRLTDPRTNIQAGARYLAWLLTTFKGDTELALAAYNAGEGAVQRAGWQIPNYRETRDYVRKVTELHHNLLPPRALSQQREAERLPAAARARSPSPTATL